MLCTPTRQEAAVDGQWFPAMYNTKLHNDSLMNPSRYSFRHEAFTIMRPFVNYYNTGIL